MNSSAVSKRLGLHPNTISVMRHSQKEKYKYIQEMDPDFELGYPMYKEEQSDVLASLQNMYFELEDRRKLSAFSKYLSDLGLYKNPNVWQTIAYKNMFLVSLQDTLSHSGFILKKKVLKAYQTFKKDYNVKDCI